MAGAYALPIYFNAAVSEQCNLWFFLRLHVLVAFMTETILLSF